MERFNYRNKNETIINLKSECLKCQNAYYSHNRNDCVDFILDYKLRVREHFDYENLSFVEKVNFIRRHVEIICHKTPQGDIKRWDLKFYLYGNGHVFQVCEDTFCSTIGIKVQAVHKALNEEISEQVNVIPVQITDVLINERGGSYNKMY